MKKKLMDFLSDIECDIASVFVFIMMVIVFVNAMARYIAGLDAAWSYEIVTSSFVLVSMFAAANVFKDDGHIGFEYIVERTHGRVRLVLDWIRNILCTIFFAIMIIYGFEMVASKIQIGLRSAVLLMPSWIIGLMIPLSGILCVIRYYQGYFKKRKAEKEKESEAK